MLKLLITGLPRRGTTITYSIIVASNPDIFAPYEPTSPTVIKALLNGKAVTHDYLGSVRNDVYKLPREFWNWIVTLKDWYSHYGSNPKFYNSVLLSFFDKLHETEVSLIVKDLYSMLILEQLLERLDNLHVILTIRDRERWIEAILKWYREYYDRKARARRSLEKVRQMSFIEVLKKIYKIFSVVKYVLSKDTHPYLFGLLPFLYRYGIDFDIRKFVDVEYLTEVLEVLYERYVKHTKHVVSRFSDRVHIVNLEKLQIRNSEEVENLRRFLRNAGLELKDECLNMIRQV